MYTSRSMPSAFDDDGTNSDGIFDVGTSIRKNTNPFLEIEKTPEVGSTQFLRC